jgi:hypothetical protein
MTESMFIRSAVLRRQLAMVGFAAESKLEVLGDMAFFLSFWDVCLSVTHNLKNR